MRPRGFSQLLGPAGLVLGVAGSLLAAAPAPAEPAACGPDGRELLGFVVAVSGSAWAENPACESSRRPLQCGEALREGDHVVTATGGRVAFLAQKVYAQMDAESELALRLTPGGAPDVALVRGRVRVIDQREDEGAAPNRVATPDAETLARGNDTEAAAPRAGADPQTAYSTLCEWARPVDVSRLGDGERTVAKPGECAVARPHVALYTTPGQESRVSLADTEQCDLADVIGDSTDRFDPTDVAGGPELVLAGPPSGGAVQPPVCVGGAGQCGGGGGPGGGGRTPPRVLPPAPPPSPVVESPPTFKPPPGLPVRPRPGGANGGALP